MPNSGPGTDSEKFAVQESALDCFRVAEDAILVDFMGQQFSGPAL
jgi:hypothetical protein